MLKKIRPRLAETPIVAFVVLCAASAAPAQNIVVDTTPTHVLNTFSPPHALGGAIDRLRAGTGAPGTEDGPRLSKEQFDKNTDTLLSEPVLGEILGAGWQTVTYRQNTELMVEERLRHLEQSRQEGRLLHGKLTVGEPHSPLVRLSPAASRFQPRRWQRMVAPH